MGVDWIAIAFAIATVTVFLLVSNSYTRWRFHRSSAKTRKERVDPVQRDRLHGTLIIQGNTLYYTRSGSPIWSVDLGAVRLIGERTTEAGPFGDDWFLVVFSADPFETHEAPIYANPSIHEELSRALGSHIRPQLTNSTKLRTSIAWPHHLEAQPFLHYTRALRGKSLASRLKDRLDPLVQQQLTERALEQIRGGNAGAASQRAAADTAPVLGSGGAW